MRSSIVLAKNAYSRIPTDRHGCNGIPFRLRADCTRQSTTRNVRESLSRISSTCRLANAAKRSESARSSPSSPGLSGNCQESFDAPCLRLGEGLPHPLVVPHGPVHSELALDGLEPHAVQSQHVARVRSHQLFELLLGQLRPRHPFPFQCDDEAKIRIFNGFGSVRATDRPIFSRSVSAYVRTQPVVRKSMPGRERMRA